MKPKKKTQGLKRHRKRLEEEECAKRAVDE